MGLGKAEIAAKDLFRVHTRTLNAVSRGPVGYTRGCVNVGALFPEQ